MSFSKKLMINLPLLMIWPLFVCFSIFLTAYGVLSKNPLMTVISKKWLNGVRAKVFSSIKPLISILEFSKDDVTKTQIASILQKLCSTNLYTFSRRFCQEWNIFCRKINKFSNKQIFFCHEWIKKIHKWYKFCHIWNKCFHKRKIFCQE